MLRFSHKAGEAGQSGGGAHKRTLSGVLAAVFAAVMQASGAAEFSGLLDELGDRGSLAMHPNGAYRQLQVSSADTRQSRLGRPGNFYNRDWSNYRRIAVNSPASRADDENVLFEDFGPGVISRIWMTGDSGTLTGAIEIYVDDAEVPLLAGSYWELLGGSGNNPFGRQLAFESRAHEIHKAGANFYAPIPYRRYARIVYRGNGGSIQQIPQHRVFYNVNYRKYRPDAAVTGLTRDTLRSARGALERVNEAVGGWPERQGDGERIAVADYRLLPGASFRRQLTNGGAIHRLAVNLNRAKVTPDLHRVMIRLVFDDQVTADMPLLYFFGNGSPGHDGDYNVYRDLYRSIDADGWMTSLWVMPFKRHGTVIITNDSGAVIDLDVELEHAVRDWDDASSMHFHANFIEESGLQSPANQRDNIFDDRGRADNAYDWRYLTVRGKGVFVGDTFAIDNSDSPAAGNWWGEGDEKIYVDYLDADGAGHRRPPDHFGTGTEDYYGYAYGHFEPIPQNPFVLQPLAEGNFSKEHGADGKGVTVNSRVRGLDAIPFNESFKFDMEIWHWKNTRLGLNATTYWYGAPGAAAMRTAADLAVDFRVGGKARDSAGDGSWQYLRGDAPLAVLARAGYGWHQSDPEPAVFKPVPKGREDERSLAAMGSGYREISLRPGLIAGRGGTLVLRWTAGPSSAGLANVSGALHKVLTDRRDTGLTIRRNGGEVFSGQTQQLRQDEIVFDFDLRITPGDRVDFVVTGTGDNYVLDDEARLRATVRVLE